jgi:hypothetical protein
MRDFLLACLLACLRNAKEFQSSTISNTEFPSDLMLEFVTYLDEEHYSYEEKGFSRSDEINSKNLHRGAYFRNAQQVSN